MLFFSSRAKVKKLPTLPQRENKSPFPLSSSLMIQRWKRLSMLLFQPPPDEAVIPLSSLLQIPSEPRFQSASGALLKRYVDSCAICFFLLFLSQIFSGFAEQVFLNGSLSEAGLVSHDSREKWRRLINISGLLTLAVVPSRDREAVKVGGVH